MRDLLSDELEPVRLELDPLGGLLLNGLTRIQCGSIHEVLACLDTGNTYLSSGPDLSNAGFARECIVADSGCLSRIPDSNFFHPGSASKN